MPPSEHVVCRVDELPPGTMRLVPIGRYGVGVFNVDGELYAITNYCPHQGAPLCRGRVQGTTTASDELPDRAAYVHEGRVLRCPWHQWEFDLATGKTIAEPRKGIRTYPVRIEGEEVVLTR